MSLRTMFLWCISFIGVIAISAMAQNTNLLKNGGFESGKPSLFTAEAGTSGATLTWASDQKHNGTKSLKIVKATTVGSARWVSGNNVRYWVDNIPSGVDIKIGAWVKTSGVNTAPANADAKWQVKYAFYDTNMVIIGAPVALDVDQSVATKDWYADTNAVGVVILPKTAYKVIISAEAGANATGTVWFDDFIFIGRGGAWAGQNWNGFVDADSSWQYWIAPMGGNDGLTFFPSSGVTTEQARTGTSSLKIAASVGRETGELVWFTETVPVTSGKSYVVSAWVMTSGIKKDSVFNASSQLGFTATWHSKLFADAGGWNEVGGADYRFTLKDTATGWTQYSWIVTAPADANAISVRARSWPLWTGVSYWDDFAVEPLANTSIIGSAGGFESGKPSLFTAEAGTSGATLTWASDQKHNGTKSLKIVKATTVGSARWVSGNNVRYWVDNIPSGVDIKIGAWVKTSGVNTAPANADAKWQVKYAFYDTNMVIIGAPVALDVDQSVATKDWYADTNAVGVVILPKTAYKVIISAEAGANATGTVWFDDFIFIGRGGAWAGQNWNGFVDADSSWQYWIAPMGGNDGLTFFPSSGVTTEQARTGTSSLKIAASVGRETGELVWFTETVPVTSGKSYVVSAWVMTSGIKKDSVFNASSQLGFTATWHSKLFADAGGWNEVGGADYRFTLKDTATGWTQYSWIVTAPADANAISVRARSWPLWTGVSYWDDFAVNGIENVPTSVHEYPTVNTTLMPSQYSLEQNYPNPFNPTTNIVYKLANSGSVKLEVFNVIGQKVASLVDEVQNAGVWTVRWNGSDAKGKQVSSGIYFYRLTTGSFVSAKKMMFIK